MIKLMLLMFVMTFAMFCVIVFVVVVLLEFALILKILPDFLSFSLNFLFQLNFSEMLVL